MSTKYKIVVDGNDGTGKTTLVKSLRSMGYVVLDRGLPTMMTDNPSLNGDEKEDEIYIILDISVEESRRRLAKAGKDLNEQYHTVEDLNHYRNRYFEIVKRLPRCMMIDASGDEIETFKRAVEAIEYLLKTL